MKEVCSSDNCTGCKACIEACSRKAIAFDEKLQNYHAVINENMCVDCGICTNVCQNHNPLEKNHPVEWYQGWSMDQQIRSRSASGGLASAIAKNFIEKSGVVYGCTFSKGNFGFERIDNINDLEKIAGSKYVKSNPDSVFMKIKKDLSDNFKVLFIGLPCQVAAVKLFVGAKYAANLYTIDLICHGSPSQVLLKLFLKQYNVELDKTTKVEFRIKNSFKVRIDNKSVIGEGGLDCYSLAFFNSLSYTEKCYSCNYAEISRVSDLTLGDSWGSELSDSEKDKGISLMLCMNEKGSYLLKISGCCLHPVDLENAINHNHQLHSPSKKHNKYDDFFDYLNKGTDFNKAVAKVLPRQYINQKIKRILNAVKIK